MITDILILAAVVSYSSFVIHRHIKNRKNPKAGCGGSVINLLQMEKLNHSCSVKSGVLENECRSIMKEFFSRFRKKNTVD